MSAAKLGPCGDCQFWTGKIVGLTYTDGICRRYPPTAGAVRFLSPTEGCGEYSPKEEREPRA